MRRGELWWASLPTPRGSEPGYRRPVLIVQANEFNTSAIGTVLVAAITTNLRLAGAPGNVPLTKKRSGLRQDSVVNLSQILTINKSDLQDRIGQIEGRELHALNEGLRLVLAIPG